MTMVELDKVTFRYPGSNSGVEEISLTIAKGELLAVIGASGSGKTTILKLIAGFEKPVQGDIRVGGDSVLALDARRRNLGIVFQSYALFPLMTVLENVAYPLKVRQVPKKERRQKAGEMLERVGLSSVGDRLPASLSGGQRQRVALCRALVFQPRALLLDEPLSALDAALRLEMRDEIRRLQKEQNIAALHITHDQEEALSMADRVAVVREGRLLQVAGPQELYDRPVNRAVAEFVGQANLWTGTTTGPNEVDVGFIRLQTDPHHFPSGRKITVMVRPENIKVETATTGPNNFPCVIQRDRFLGSVRRFDARVNNGVVIGESSYRGAIGVIHIPPSSVLLMDQ